MKRKEYNLRQQLVSNFMDAFASPARVAICDYLIEHGPSFFANIHEALPLAKATVSQHLVVLRNAGVINAKEMTPRVLYSINKENMLMAKEEIDKFLQKTLDAANKPQQVESDK